MTAGFNPFFDPSRPGSIPPTPMPGPGIPPGGGTPWNQIPPGWGGTDTRAGEMARQGGLGGDPGKSGVWNQIPPGWGSLPPGPVNGTTPPGQGETGGGGTTPWFGGRPPFYGGPPGGRGGGDPNAGGDPGKGVWNQIPPGWGSLPPGPVNGTTPPGQGETGGTFTMPTGGGNGTPWFGGRPPFNGGGGGTPWFGGEPPWFGGAPPHVPPLPTPAPPAAPTDWKQWMPGLGNTAKGAEPGFYDRQSGGFLFANGMVPGLDAGYGQTPWGVSPDMWKQASDYWYGPGGMPATLYDPERFQTGSMGAAPSWQVMQQFGSPFQASTGGTGGTGGASRYQNPFIQSLFSSLADSPFSSDGSGGWAANTTNSYLNQNTNPFAPTHASTALGL